MLLPHAITLAEARLYIAALADQAGTFDASIAYEHVLLELDAVYDGQVPPMTAAVLTDESSVLYTIAEAAVEELVDHGADALRVELILAGLQEARTLDRS